MPLYKFKGTLPLGVIQTVIMDCVSLSFDCAEVSEVSFTNLSPRAKGWEMKYLPVFEKKLMVVSEKLASIPAISPDPTRELVVFIGIMSQPGRFDLRLAQRETFMTHPLVTSGKVVFKFFLTSSASEVLQRAMEIEAETFGDVVLLPETELYLTINYKVLRIFRYFCSPQWDLPEGVPHMIGKTDDDVYIDLNVVYNDLHRRRQEALGFTMFATRENSSPNSFWYWTTGETREYKHGIPPYPAGTFYLISGPLVRSWIKMEEETGALVSHPMEDRQTGLWIAQFERQTGNRVNWSAISSVVNVCQPGALVVHHVLPDDIRCLHKSVVNTGKVVCCTSGGVVWH